MRFAFDIGGVISKEPHRYRVLMEDLRSRGHDVFVLTDMSFSKAVETLDLNDIPYDVLVCADYDAHGEMCKDVVLRQHSIDFFFDDFIGYVSGDGAPIRLLVMPDASRPYWHDDWKTPDGESQFGRRRWTKTQMKGRD